MTKHVIGGAGFWTSTLTAVMVLPPTPVTSAARVCAPFGTVVVVQRVAYGCSVTGRPSGLPSRRNSTDLTATPSLARAATGMVPETAWPAAGLTSAATGAAVLAGLTSTAAKFQ